MKYYRVKVTTKEPYETRLKKEQSATTGVIEWEGYAHNHGFAFNAVKEMLGSRGFTVNVVQSIEEADSKESAAAGQYKALAGYPQQR